MKLSQAVLFSLNLMSMLAAPALAAEVKLIVWNQMTGLCSQNSAWIATEWTGTTCGAAQIRWDSMHTLNPSFSSDDCQWDGADHDATWKAAWLGSGCGVSPTQIRLPTSLSELTSARAVAVHNTQPGLCSRSNVPVTTLWTGSYCGGYEEVKYDNMKTLDPHPTLAGVVCEWNRANYAASWTSVWLGDCAVRPTAPGLPDIQTKLVCGGKAGTIVEPNRDFRGEDKWYSPNRKCYLKKIWNGRIRTRHQQSSSEIWESGDGATMVLTMQSSDGNLVLYDDSCFIFGCWRVAKWSTGTAGNPGARAVMEDGGFLKIYKKNSCEQLYTSTNTGYTQACS